MKKNSLFVNRSIVLSLLLSFMGGGLSFAQTDRKPGKGGSDPVQSAVVPAAIQLPPSAVVPVVEAPSTPTPTPTPATPTPTVDPGVAIPATTGIQPALVPLPLTSQVGGVSTGPNRPGGKGGKAGGKRRSSKIKSVPRSKVKGKVPAKALVSDGQPASLVDAVTPHPKVKSQKEAKKIKSAPKHLLATPGEGVEAVSKSTSAHPTAKTPQAFDARTGEVEALDLKSVEVKTGDAKPADVKAVGVKTGAVETVDAKPVEVKAVDAKAGAVEAVDAKPVEVKTAKQESAAPGKGCEDAALKKIYDLMLHDQANTLGIMFELTAMRLAKRSLEQMPKATTFEELTRGNIKTLEKRLNGIKSSVEMQKQVKEIYETYGKKNDLKLISKDLNQMMKRNHDACYFSKNQRFQNDEASSYILAVSVGEKDSEVSDIDAATVWVVERARAEAEKTDPEHYALGKENGNLLNISTRVSRYLGRIEDGKNATADVMADLIQTEEKKLVSVLAGAYLQVKTSLKTCLLQETNNCEKCTLTRLDNFEKEKGGIDQIQRGLLSSVAKSDNLKMEQDLKGKMGDVVYDFSNFAKKGEKDVIPPNPPRGKYDACGHVLGASHAGPAKAPVSRSPGTKAPSNNQVGPESIAPLDPRIVPAN